MAPRERYASSPPLPWHRGHSPADNGLGLALRVAALLVPGAEMQAGRCQVGAIVLAGGESRRMGTDKALVDFLGMPMVRWVVTRLSHATWVAGGSPRVVVAAPEARLPALRAALAGLESVELAADAHEGRGPLAGLHAGLVAAGPGHHFVVSVDQPLLDTAFACHLVERATRAGADAVVPRWEGTAQVLHAVYGAPAAAERAACQLAAAKDMSLRALLRSLVRVIFVDEPEIRRFGDPGRLFLDADTPQALEAARRLAGALPRPSPGQPPPYVR